MSSILRKCINSFLGVKGNIIEVKFKVEGRIFKAYVPDDQYWTAIKDILLNREYEYVPEFELKNFRGLVIDAGAQVGLFSLISSLFAKKVIALEPHPTNYSLLKINLERNLANNVIPMNLALWCKNEKLKIYEGDQSGGHSIYHFPYASFFEASTITLRDLVREFGNIDLLKIDVEGSEFRIFREIDDETLKHVNAIVGEIHLDYGDANLIVAKLKNSGFKVRTFYPPLWRKENAYSIKLYDLLRLKLLRNFLYSVYSLLDFKNKHLLIFFGLQGRASG